MLVAFVEPAKVEGVMPRLVINSIESSDFGVAGGGHNCSNIVTDSSFGTMGDYTGAYGQAAGRFLYNGGELWDGGVVGVEGQFYFSSVTVWG